MPAKLKQTFRKGTEVRLLVEVYMTYTAKPIPVGSQCRVVATVQHGWTEYCVISFQGTACAVVNALNLEDLKL